MQSTMASVRRWIPLPAAFDRGGMVRALDICLRASLLRGAISSCDCPAAACW
jgi:hypothetical protein